MSAMAITATTRKRQSVSGSTITTYHSLAFTGTYATGGDALDANALSGLSNIDNITFHGLTHSTAFGYEFLYDYTNKKLMVFGETTEAVVGAVEVGDAETAGGRPGIQVANGLDLTGITALHMVVTGTR